ncbi:MAG: sel1 repeat family protein [Clostridia bacterium]|nr:sel1 repeat family protein [Clostridia bacterium]
MMIICKKCKSDVAYNGPVCPVCRNELLIDENDMKRARGELAAALKDKNEDRITSLYHLLADGGDTVGCREYARILEKTDPISSIDTAMEYYRRAADGHDPFAAYKYSSLVGRVNLRASSFYLRYAAILGEKASYTAVSEHYSALGNEQLAAYYCYLAAEGEDTVAMINMAKRYNEGIGVPESQECAKWYLDKMTIPPISALKLAVKLRGVKALMPERPPFPDYEKALAELAREATALEAPFAFFKINSMLADLGNINAIATLGVLYAEGEGVERSLDRAKHYLDLAANKGNAVAALYLADEYASGEIFPLSVQTALAYYHRSAALGYTAAYEKLGDLYNTGTLVERDVKRALEYYELAAGCREAEKKANDIKTKRYEFYKSGCAVMQRQATASPEEAANAYRAFAIATAMGEPSSALMLATCYERGFGTERDMATAFYWYKTAYEDGDGNALLPLALCYSRGAGTAFDYRTAVKLLSLAARTSAAARDELALLQTRKMKRMVRALYSTAMELIHQKKYKEAHAVLLAAVPFGYPKALYTLGCLYEFGVGLGECDRAKANEYYERAMQDGGIYPPFRDLNAEYKLKILKIIR